MDIQVDVYASAFYSCLKNASVTDSDSLREVQFTAPQTADYDDTYTIHWGGSCVLQQLYSPNGQDMLQLAKKEVYQYFRWGFVYFTFNPMGLANRHGLDGKGLWRIQMKIADPSVPSLYVSDGFRVTIHRSQYEWETKSLAVGQSYAASLPSVPNWFTEEVSYFGINANSSQIDVEGALLEWSYHSVSEGTVYDRSYWRPYNQTLKITNIWTSTLSLEIWISTNTFRHINHEVNGQGLGFTLNSSTFESTRASDYLSLDIVATVFLNSSTLYDPNGDKAKDLYKILSEEYYTLGVTCGIYKVSVNPYYAWRVLENNVYGAWELRFEMLGETHDVAVTNVRPCRTVVDRNCTTKMNVTVANQGSFTETFNVTVHADLSHLIGTQTLTLDSGERTNLTFAWNIKGFPVLTLPANCTLLATASIVQNETYTNNNNSTCYIQISIKGDTNADGKVDIKDIAAAAKAFGTGLGDIKWQANADVNEDQQIDIRDIAAIAKEFGKTT